MVGVKRVSRVEGREVRAAIANNRSAVPAYLDLMGSDAGDGARTRGLVAVAADPDDAVT